MISVSVIYCHTCFREILPPGKKILKIILWLIILKWNFKWWIFFPTLTAQFCHISPVLFIQPLSYAYTWKIKGVADHAHQLYSDICAYCLCMPSSMHKGDPFNPCIQFSEAGKVPLSLPNIECASQGYMNRAVVFKSVNNPSKIVIICHCLVTFPFKNGNLCL